MPFVSFLERFEAVVRERPDAVALLCDDGRALTYRALADRAARLGARLRARGAGPERVVALLLGRSPDHVTALLAAWYAGAAFLPLDAGVPEARIEFVLRDSGAALVLRGVEPGDLAADTAPAPAPSPDGLAYVVYTSGSTGDPKGVLVPHRGIVNFLDAQLPVFRLGPRSRVLWFLSPAFDASISELGTTLLAGATLCVEPSAAGDSPGALLRRLAERRITHLFAPPALLPALDADRLPDCLETLVIGGEACPPAVVRRFAARVRVVNVYGPTEATVCTSLVACDAATWDRPLIGRPIPGVTLRLLDEAGRPAPAGAPAELYIGGVGLARGYRERPELDAARFVTRDGERLYRTGDLVRQGQDGELEFVGRVDRQLKVRGQLVAPEEVEARLREHPGVALAAVVRRRGPGGRDQLCACVVPSAAGALDVDELAGHLAATLPRFMVPQRWELLERLPLTATGKVDTAELARRPLGPARSAGAPPATPEEGLLAGIWRCVLGVAAVGVTDDFFELGGDSLAAVEVAAAAEAAGLPLSPSLVLSHPTVRAAAARLDPTEAADAATLRSDVAFDAGWAARLRAAAARPGAPPDPATPRAILLTGATGFFGARLLGELLRRTRAELRCLVRARDGGDARRRVLAAVGAVSSADERRVVAIPGDLERPCLGLAGAEWAELAAEVDTVHHAAAQVNLALPYAALRAGNVGGTASVLRLVCEGRRKRLHHVSSLSVFVATDRTGGRMDEDDELSATRTVHGGYAQTKWAAEALLRAAPEAGPLACYRLGLLTGDAATGRAAPGDWLTLFLRGAASLGCLPAGAAELAVDVTPVDFAAAAVAHLSLAAPPSTFHVANAGGATVAELAAALRAAGAPVDLVPDDEWGRRAAERLAGAPDAAEAAAYLALCRALGAGAFGRHRPLDLFQATGVVFGAERTRAGLAGSGIACPPPGRELLATYARAALGG